MMSKDAETALAESPWAGAPLEARLTQALKKRDRLAAECQGLRKELDSLRDELKLRNSALNATSTHFLIADARRRGWPIVYVNKAIAADHGYEPHELLDKGATFLNPEELNPTAVKELNLGMRQGKIVRTQVVSRRKDGTHLRVGITMAPIRDEKGCLTHYVGIGADITARLEAEERARQLQARLNAEKEERERIALELQLSQRLESVGNLAAGIAHEINTPIQYIGDSVQFLRSAQADLERLLAGYRDIVQQASESGSVATALESLRQLEAAADIEFLMGEVPRAFERTLEGVDRVTDIVRAMKEFAHPGAGEQGAADLNHAIQTALIVSRSEYKYSAQVETQLGELPEVICNVGEINQVFLNLIVNAAHAIAESGKDATTGRITIATRAEQDQVRICVSDNGCGIPKENLEKIFDRFFTTKKPGRGTGQGLSIAHSIVVDRHGGRIDVQSEPGTGTSFILSLPIGGWASRAAA